MSETTPSASPQEPEGPEELPRLERDPGEEPAAQLTHPQLRPEAQELEHELARVARHFAPKVSVDELLIVDLRLINALLLEARVAAGGFSEQQAATLFEAFAAEFKTVSELLRLPLPARKSEAQPGVS